MDKLIIEFDDSRIEEYEFDQFKSPISIKDIDINKIVTSNNVPFGKQDFKYFIEYKDAKNIKLLCIFLPRMSIYKRNFLIKDEKSFVKYNEICEKVSNIIKKKLMQNLYIIKKFLKVEKKSTQKKAIIVFVNE